VSSFWEYIEEASAMSTDNTPTWNPEHLELALSGEKNLERFNLQGADLQGANLYGANLQEANLWDADLTRATLREADLTRAKLSCATLRAADLTRASLEQAYLNDANLQGVSLKGVENLSPGQLINAKNVHLASDLPFSLQEVILAKQFAEAEMEDDS